MEKHTVKDHLSNRNIYTVPDGYFEALEHTIRQRTETTGSPTLRLSPFTLKLAAVAVMVTIAALILLPAPSISTRPEDLLAAVADEHLEAYLTETSGPDAEDILLPGSLTDETYNNLSDNDTIF